jgi:hypothetical protein
MDPKFWILFWASSRLQLTSYVTPLKLCFILGSFFLGVDWDWVHLVRQPLFGLLYQQRMMDDECGAVRVPGYRSWGPGSIPGATDFLTSMGLERGQLSH